MATLNREKKRKRDRERLREVMCFIVPKSELTRYRPNLPPDLLVEMDELERCLRRSGKEHFGVVIFKISPNVNIWAINEIIKRNKKQPTSVVELLLLADQQERLANRVVVAVGSRVLRKGNSGIASDFLWGLDFCGGQVTVGHYNHEKSRPRRMCFAFTVF